MKALNPWVRITAVALLASGCEFHVGNYDGDASFFDDDDEDAGSDPVKTAKPTATPPKTSTAAPQPSEDAGETPDGGAPDTGTEPTQAAASTAPAATTAAAATSASMMPASYLCAAPEAEDACDQCLATHCAAERTACCGENCENLWPDVQQCMAMIQDAGDPVQAQEDLDACILLFDPERASDMDPVFNDVVICVNSTYPTPEDDTGHYPGDGTCTFECYGVTTLME